MQEPKVGRRIVSKGQFAQFQAEQAGIRFLSIFLTITVIVSAVAIFASLASMFSPNRQVGTEGGPGLWVLFFPVYTIVALPISRHMQKKAEQRNIEMADMVLVTRANTADLPAPDSLVRASQEPTQVQEGVLLRAASGEAQAGQEGQLLRASVGGQE